MLCACLILAQITQVGKFRIMLLVFKVWSWMHCTSLKPWSKADSWNAWGPDNELRPSAQVQELTIRYQFRDNYSSMTNSIFRSTSSSWFPTDIWRCFSFCCKTQLEVLKWDEGGVGGAWKAIMRRTQDSWALKTEFKLGCFVLTFQMRTVVSLEPVFFSSFY